MPTEEHCLPVNTKSFFEDDTLLVLTEKVLTFASTSKFKCGSSVRIRPDCVLCRYILLASSWVCLDIQSVAAVRWGPDLCVTELMLHGTLRVFEVCLSLLWFAFIYDLHLDWFFWFLRSATLLKIVMPYRLCCIGIFAGRGWHVSIATWSNDRLHIAQIILCCVGPIKFFRHKYRNMNCL